MSDYEIIRYRPELKPQVAELQKHLWSPDLAANAAYLEWKYEQSPFHREPFLYVALAGREVVGMRGFYGGPWRGGQPIRALSAICAGDLVVQPAHRNRGLPTRIMDFAQRDLSHAGYDYMISLSANRVTRFGSIMMGWRNAGPLTTLRKRQPARNVFSIAARMKPSRRKQDWMKKIDRRVDASRVPLAPDGSWSRTPRSGEMAELVSRAEPDGRFSTVYDLSYLTWRFRNPFSRYGFIYHGNERLDGYLVLHESVNRRRDWLSVADIRYDHISVAYTLLEAAVRLAADTELRLWRITMAPEIIAFLGQRGFIPLDDSRHGHDGTELLVRPTRDPDGKAHWSCAGQSLTDLSNWNLRMLDSDGC